ncbi:MAG: hypothetical protein SAJ12_00745 [Jaaginema sp. PMC 1079.18]|nr:hypothetical protein [Jaaginema sp. PMC 1080.18]MEC4849511.1 hypothetical protein [Jaaginema sp. PMC 1079.18]MEC4865610.1 hypothetical protein [Jaaginema sp. PMC 1078.18]
MLVILTNEQVLQPQQVCQSCLLADRSGRPRWQQGKLCCGRAVAQKTLHQPDVYECQMGFRVADIG